MAMTLVVGDGGRRPCTAIALLIATAAAVAPVSSFRIPLGPGRAAAVAIPRRRLLTPLVAAYPRVSIPPRDLRSGGGGGTSSPSDSTWIRRAADRLRRDGVCALVAEGRGDEHRGACLDAATCNDAAGRRRPASLGFKKRSCGAALTPTACGMGRTASARSCAGTRAGGGSMCPCPGCRVAARQGRR